MIVCARRARFQKKMLPIARLPFGESAPSIGDKVRSAGFEGSCSLQKCRAFFLTSTSDFGYHPVWEGESASCALQRLDIFDSFPINC